MEHQIGYPSHNKAPDRRFEHRGGSSAMAGTDVIKMYVLHKALAVGVTDDMNFFNGQVRVVSSFKWSGEQARGQVEISWF